MVVFHLPSGGDKPILEIGLVMSVWKGVKSPKVVSGECHVNSCMAFRVISLDIEDPDDSLRWTCSRVSNAWVVRIEALVTILDCESCRLSALNL